MIFKFSQNKWSCNLSFKMKVANYANIWSLHNASKGQNIVLILHPTPTHDEMLMPVESTSSLFVVTRGHTSWYLALHYVDSLWIPGASRKKQNLHLGIAKSLLESMSFIRKSPTQIPYSNCFCSLGLTLLVTISLSNQAMARCQTTRDSLYTPEPAEIIQTSQSSICLFCLTHFFLWKL